MTSREQLLADIEAFLKAHHMDPTPFGFAAIGDGTFVRRVRNGAGCSLDTADRIRQFMAAYRPAKRHRTAA